jgi:hypothetical protein
MFLLVLPVELELCKRLDRRLGDGRLRVGIGTKRNVGFHANDSALRDMLVCTATAGALGQHTLRYHYINPTTGSV